jgi:hypothetical protein
MRMDRGCGTLAHEPERCTSQVSLFGTIAQMDGFERRQVVRVGTLSASAPGQWRRWSDDFDPVLGSGSHDGA